MNNLAGGGEVAGSVAQMLGSLVLVIGIILILCYFIQRFLKVTQRGGSRYIRVIETRHLAPKKSLMLVEVGGEYLLLSNSSEGISFITKVEMLEEIEVVDEQKLAALIPGDLKNRLKTLAGELPLGTGRMGGFKKSGGFA